jgi:hypothetical protein
VITAEETGTKPQEDVVSAALDKNGEMLLGCSGRTTLRREQCDMSGRPNYLRYKIAIARQRIQLNFSQQFCMQCNLATATMGNCCNLVTVCKHAYIVATSRPTIDPGDNKRRKG